MPLGVQRINAPQSAHPTPHIAFIKPLPGPGATEAEEYLSRVAAIVHPILAAHHLAVMTLEEHEPNAEFLGRNFNAGEVIQLVLRRRQSHSHSHSHSNWSTTSSTAVPRNVIQTVTTVAARTGPGSEASPLWLPFRSVVLVMLHELAHCVQMNHSRAFWKVRNGYAAEMRELWAKGYRGEGMWGRGKALGSTLELDGPSVGLEDDMPAHLCGGVYRRRRRGKKRKRAADGGSEQLTYAERQQRRIKKKFGEGGTALGDDAIARAELEKKGKGKGKKTPSAAKPRVAQSNRGRELRAQAALARLGQLGQNGESSVKSEERQMQAQLPFTKTKTEPEPDATTSIKQEDISTDDETESASGSEPEYSSVTTAEDQDLIKVCPDSGRDEGQDAAEHVKAERRELDDIYSIPLAAPSPTADPEPAEQVQQQLVPSDNEANGGEEILCPACSLANSPLQACCVACGCVLRPEKVPNHWRCQKQPCKDGTYVNSGDYGVCGVCGARREEKEKG